MPEFTELEWAIRPRLEEWAEVASYDAPGVGAESVSEEELDRLAADPGFRRSAIAERGLESLARRGWDSCVLVGDTGGGAAACLIARARPDAVEAIALGHACLSYETKGERSPINSEVSAAMTRLVEQDREEFIRHALTQLTGGSYTEELAGRMLDRVPVRLLTRAWLQGSDEGPGALLAEIDCPLLFVQHRGCLMYTDEGFEDAVEAFPRARTMSVDDKPSVSEEFAAGLREFCEATLAAG